MQKKIGIPRGLMYHYYYPLWKVFFEKIGLKVVLSPPTDKRIMNEGVKIAVDDICLPFKVYYGHVYKLISLVDCLFVPRFISLGKNNFICPKFMGLPDMLRAHFDSLPELIVPDIDFRKGIFPLRKIIYNLGRKFNAGFLKTEFSFLKALKAQKACEEIQNMGYTPEESFQLYFTNQNITEKKKGNEDLKIGVLGHSYLINDEFLSRGILNHLKKMGAHVLTAEMFDFKTRESESSRQRKKLFWFYNRQVMGAAYHFMYNKDIDGIIQVNAFGCGPDSMVSELINIRCKNKGTAVLNLNLDEHTGEAGILTRLEAFVDLLMRKRVMA